MGRILGIFKMLLHTAVLHLPTLSAYAPVIGHHSMPVRLPNVIICERRRFGYPKGRLSHSYAASAELKAEEPDGGRQMVNVVPSPSLLTTSI